MPTQTFNETSPVGIPKRTVGGRTIRIGAGSAWWGDRISPAEANAHRGALDYLCFETMAEATVSMAQVRRLRDAGFAGYDTYLEDRMRAVLPHCIRNGTRIISNQGWINPVGAARKVRELLAEFGGAHLKVAAVTGSDVTARIRELAGPIMENGKRLEEIHGEIVSAEAYLGAEGIVEALADGADIVITGRVADPSLFLAPMIHEFGWHRGDWTRYGQGTGIGHLLECGAQVTGGYFADPGFKDVPNPWDLAFPIAVVSEDGSAVIEKLDGTGGLIDRRTVLEQMFYEVHNPAAYITPDVVADFTSAEITPTGPDKVRVSNIGGTSRTPTLKVSIGVREGFIGEDTLYFAGPGSLEKSKLAERILRERFRIVGLQADELRFDRIGVDSIQGAMTRRADGEPGEVAVRVAARTRTKAEADKIGREVDGMAVSGIASTGKRVPHGERTREVIGIWSTLIDRSAVHPEVHFV